MTDLFGEDAWADMPFPEAGSEDMAFVLEEVPGAYLNVSACALDDHRLAEDNHSPQGGVRRLGRAGRRGRAGGDGTAPVTAARPTVTTATPPRTTLGVVVTDLDLTTASGRAGCHGPRSSAG